MKKKEIEKIPFHGGTRADRKYLNTAVAFFQEIKEEQHLFVEIYENQKQKLKTPWIRMVFTQKDWGLYYPDGKYWSAAGLTDEESEIGCDLSRKYNKCYMSKKQSESIWEFSGIDTWKKKYHTWVAALKGLIDDIRYQRNRKKDENRRIRLQEREKNTPPLPTDLTKWAETILFGLEHFLYYKKSGRYTSIACSACGQVTEIAFKKKDTFEGMFEKSVLPPYHNQPGICPHCGASGIYKGQGKTKGVYGKGINCFVAQRYKTNGAVIRYVEIEKVYRMDTMLEEDKEIMTGAGERTIVTEIARTYLEEGKRPQTDYHKFSSYSGEFWDDCNLCGMNIIHIKSAKVYPKSYKELKNTFLKYSAAESYENYKSIYNLGKYLERYIQWPQMEMLTRSGLYKITEAIMNGECGIIAKENGRRPEEFLGIYKDRIRELIAVQGDTDYLKIWQMERRRKQRLTDKEIIFLKESGIRDGDLGEILKHTTITKFMHKMEQYSGCDIPGDLQTPMCGRSAGMLKTIVSTYVDYLHMRIQRGYDLENQIFLFPRDLQMAHDQMVLETHQEEIQKRKQKVEERYPDIRKNYRRLRNQYFYEDEDYLIRPARSAEEIVAEGRILHHCVGGDSYLNKHNTGRSTILFLRSKSAPETPYITIEICGAKIRQWYGIRDTKPDEIRIERHLRRYIKVLKEKDQIKSVTA